MDKNKKPPAKRTLEDWEKARELNRDDEKELTEDDSFKRTDRKPPKPGRPNG